MSLRLKLFLVFGGLMAVVVLAQWLLIRSLNRDIYSGFTDMAASVGRGMASIFVLDTIQSGEEVKLRREKHKEQGSSPDHEMVFVHETTSLLNTEQNYELLLDQDNNNGKVERRIHRRLDENGNLVVTEVIRCNDCPEGTRQQLASNKQVPEALHWVKEQDQSGVYSWKMVIGEVPSVSQGSGPDHDDRGPTPELTEKSGNQETQVMAVVSPAADGAKEKPTRVFFRADPANINNVAIKLEADSLIFENDDQVQSIPLPRSKVDEAVQKASNTMLAGSLLILLFGLICGGYIAHRVSKPLADLSKAAREVGDGALGSTVVPPTGYPEISEAINAFNAMSLRLQELDGINRRNQQRRHLSELGEIARGFAHTIRNPLNTLGLSLEHMSVLAGDKDESHRLTVGAQKQIQRIDHLIRSFLALASEGGGHVEALDVAGLMQDIALEIIQSNPGGIVLDLDIAPQLPTLAGVAPELRSVVQALVVNALEASPQGGRVTIRVTADEQQNLIIQISDQGAGLSEDVQKRLFTPHVTTKTYGSGMGLFLAHRLATGRYRGQLTIKNSELAGAVATLILPKDNEYATDPAADC